ncbi:hypothetical protein [Singulisphaera sp. PoT]|uniref:hypothetical protein n=1 Tax=Singulisphaera sp. PoT TaxID=3411797 RepID=UPI003BF53830
MRSRRFRPTLDVLSSRIAPSGVGALDAGTSTPPPAVSTNSGGLTDPPPIAVPAPPVPPPQ